MTGLGRVLDIRQQENAFVFHLSRVEDRALPGVPVQWDVPIAVDVELVNELSGEIRRITEQAAGGTYAPQQAEAGLRRHCQTLYDLFGRQPEFQELAEDLRRGGPLLICTAESEVTWELMHNGEGYLALINLVGRQLRTAVRPAAFAEQREPRRGLVVSNPTGEAALHDTEEQAETLVGWLEGRGIECEHLSGLSATRVRVLTDLNSGGFDLFHYCGHLARVDQRGREVAPDLAGDYALKLADGSLRGNELRSAGAGVGMVFLNGCRSARSVESLTATFLEAGALLVIGTIADVGARASGRFAERFYEQMLDGELAGESFRRAREAGLSEGNVAAWAPFIMYGNPLLQLFGATLPEELRRPWSSSCRRVIGEAVALSQAVGSVCTPTLLAALLSGEDTRLRDALAAQDVAPSSLRAALGEGLRSEQGSGRGRASVKVSRNVSRMVSRAQERAGESADIQERHLQEAFVEIGGGRMGQFLREKGLDWPRLARRFGLEGPAELAGAAERAALAGVEAAQFSAEAWEILRDSAQQAQRRGDASVRTLDLFATMVARGQGHVAGKVRNAGIPVEQLSAVLSELCQSLPVERSRASEGGPAPSANLARILLEARRRALSEQRAVTERDLWHAFVRYDGGGTGGLLRAQLGIELLVLHGDIADERGNLRLERFDESVRQALRLALSAARSSGDQGVTTPHLLAGLCALPEGGAADAFAAQGFAAADIAAGLGYPQALDGVAPDEAEAAVPVRSLTTRVQRILALARGLAAKAERPTASDADLLRAFLTEGGGSTAEALRAMGVNLRLLSGKPEAARAAAGKRAGRTPALDELGRDLTAEARAGRLRPVVGREEELDAVEEALLGATNNGVLLLGESGVGKTALAEGLAQRIAEGRAAASLREARVIELRASALVAATTYRGDFEARIERVIREAVQSRAILFIDEFHTLLGAGAVNGSSLDAANILKPYLARGEIRCIGATTVQEYRRHVEPDAALCRRFQIVQLEETSPEQTARILEELAALCEREQKVRVPAEAIESVVKLSRRYLPGRMPGKACNLLDRACARARLRQEREESPSPAAELSDEDIVAVIRKMVPGLRIGEVGSEEQQQLQELESELGQRVVGQGEAVSATARAVRLARLGLRSPKRPVAVFLFVGPSGVGKTELAKALAAALFGSEEALVRLQLSEYMEPHTVSRLLGSPPGYQSHQEGGQLTGALQRRPHAVVLLDEVEKAHRDVLNVLLRLFDEGVITDARGVPADGRNALFIMTSNIGTDLAGAGTVGLRESAAAKRDALAERILAEVNRSFPAEFVNRIDDVIAFHALSRKDVRAIAELRIAEFIAQTAEEQGTVVEVDEAVLDHLAEVGYRPAFGARALLREIESRVKRPIADMLLAGARGRLRVTLEGGEVAIAQAPADAGAEPSSRADGDGASQDRGAG